jgi:hypothetical protein
VSITTADVARIESGDPAASGVTEHGQSPGDDPALTPSAATLVGSLGDAVLVSFTLNDEPASVLMIRTEAGWRLKTLFGAAFG